MDAATRRDLMELDCASLADADKAIRVMGPGIRPINPGHKLVGVARTVRCHEDFLSIIQALDAAVPGEVLIVDTQGSRRAVVGELFSLEAARRGLTGVIIDGPVRDTRTIATLAIPVYARGTCPVSGTTTKLGQSQVAVDCGGVIVEPGDIVIGDEDGVVVGSLAHMLKLIPLAREVERKERLLRQRMEAGRSLVDLTNYKEHAAALARGEDSRLAFRLD